MLVKKPKEFLFIVVILSSFEASLALAQDCLNPRSPATQINKQVSNLLAPFKDTYLNLSRFELDPLSADIVKLENSVDPVKERKTLAFAVRGSVETNQQSKQRSSSGFLASNWLDGAVTISDNRRNALEQTLGLKTEFQFNENNHYSLARLNSMKFEDLVTSLSKNGMMSDQQLTDAMKSGIVPPVGPAASSDLYKARIMASYLKIAAQSDQAGVQQQLLELKSKLTNAEKIQLAGLIGTKAADNYDNDRAGIYGPNGDGKKGISTQFGKSIPYDSILTNLKTSDHLGVCRDIAVAQAQVLSQLGIKDVYSVAYNAGGNHAVVMARDPDHPDQILQFNYGDLASIKMKGVSSLTRTEDYSTSYDIYNAAGKSVASLPSEMGALMMEGAGGNIKTLDPFLTRPQGSLSSLTLQNDKTKMPLFVGRTSDGTLITGVGISAKKGDPEADHFSMSSTTALAYQRKTQQYSNVSVVQDAAHVMEVAKAQLASSWVSIPGAKGTTLARITTSTTFQADGAKNGLSTKRELITSIGSSQSMRGEVGVEGKFESLDHQTAIKVRAADGVALGQKNLSSVNYNHVYQNLTYVSVQGERVLIPDRLKATLDGAMGLREFGPQILVVAGAQDPKGSWSAKAGYQGNIRKSQLAVAPGSEREAFLNLEKTLSSNIQLTATYAQPIGYSVSNSQVQVGAKGSLSELLKSKKKKAPTSF